MTARQAAALAAAPALAAGVILATAGSAAAATTTLTSRASAAEEVPSPGPQGASGSATFTVDTSSGEICYQATTSGLTRLAAAHIHRGVRGVAGPVVVPLEATRINSGSRACTSSTAALAAEIARDPAGFYFNVHTPEFSAGAVRGQLVAGPTGADAGSGGGVDETGRTALLMMAVLAGGALTVASGRRLARR